MNIIIIEDEIQSRKKVEDYIQQYDPKVNIVLSTGSFKEAINTLVNHSIDLVLSDIEILDGNVFDLLTETPIICPFIFISAYDHYSFNALENHGFGYLLKPYTYEQFSIVMDNYFNLKTKISNSNERRIEALQMFQQPDYRKRIVVQSGKEKVIILKVSSVKLIEIEQGVLFAHTELGEKFVIKETLTLSNIESTLNPQTFFRINKSQIVNIDFISMYEQYGKNKVVVKLIGNKNGTLITSVNRTPLFKDWVKK
ncbi:LytR/AlgR family response regulator transcription factor [Tenacibaculum xiamenense]|uniref:LytR/AlgR family response regulator transcription factor n=1 Tax=Tenacibaculum xiamenense TaxID=1261553 RepID=UPI00389384DE